MLDWRARVPPKTTAEFYWIQFLLLRGLVLLIFCTVEEEEMTVNADPSLSPSFLYLSTSLAPTNIAVLYTCSVYKEWATLSMSRGWLSLSLSLEFPCFHFFPLVGSNSVMASCISLSSSIFPSFSLILCIQHTVSCIYPWKALLWTLGWTITLNYKSSQKLSMYNLDKNYLRINIILFFYEHMKAIQIMIPAQLMTQRSSIQHVWKWRESRLHI